jgi:hypothetical protein
MMTLSFFSCEKDPLEDCRKDPTCEYFTCKVNGVRWEPQCKGEPFFGGCTPWDVQYYKNIDWLIINVRNETLENSALIYVNGQISNNTIHEIFTENNSPSTFFLKNTIDSCSNYKVIKGYNNFLEITRFNPDLKVINGKFSFTAKNNCGDVVTITDGEFNLPYRF